MRKLLDQAVRERRISKALKMVQDGRWTLRRAASFSGLKYHELLEKMAETGVDSGPTLKELRESLDRR